MDANSMDLAKRIAEKKKRKRMNRKLRKLRKKANSKDEVENTDPTSRCLKISNNGKSFIGAEMDTSLYTSTTAKSLSSEQLKLDTVSTKILMEKSAVDQTMGGTVSTETLVAKSAVRKNMRRNSRKRAANKDDVENFDQANNCLELSHNGKDCITAGMGTVPAIDSTACSLSKEQLKICTFSTEILSDKGRTDQLKIDTASAEIPEEKHGCRKKKRKKGRRRSKSNDEVDYVDQTSKCLEISNQDKGCIAAEMGTLHDVNSTVQSLSQEQLNLETVSTENIVEKSAVEQLKIDKVSAEIVVEKSATRKKTRRKWRRKGNNEDELEIVDPTKKNMEECPDNGKSSITAELDTFPDVDSTLQSLSLEQSEVNAVPSGTVVENSATRKRKRKRKKKRMKTKVQNIGGLPSMDQRDILSNQSLSDERNGLVISTENCLAMEAGRLLKDSCQLHKRAQITCSARTHSRRILLILDINGLLADVVTPPPKERKSDINILRRAIYKRPYYDDFLNFCFETFDVGIWSSRSKRIIDRVVDYLLGDLKHKLLFCWDMYHTTKTGFKTLDNKHKPLVCKELRKLWEKSYPNLPWKKGDYDESNTLLIDDSPYKALLNPMCTAIFPYPYSFKDQSDSALGPGGDLRVYLEDLAKTDDVKKYVEQHPFGQSAITDKSSTWSFYSKVLHKLSKRSSRQLHPQFPV